MIFLLDFYHDRVPPPEKFLPAGTVVERSRSADIEEILDAHVRGGHFAHAHPRAWIRTWRKWKARDRLLRILLLRTGLLRLFDIEGRGKTDEEFPPGISWNTYLESEYRKPPSSWMGFPALDGLNSDYLGGPCPRVLFIAERNAYMREKLAFGTTGGFYSWFHLCVKSALLRPQDVGFLTLPLASAPDWEERMGPIRRAIEVIRPGFIVGMGRDFARDKRRYPFMHEVIPHPRKFKGRDPGGLAYIKILKRVRRQSLGLPVS